MRKLIWVPVVHNYADMNIPRKVALNPNGKRYEFEMRIDKFWDTVGRELSNVRPDLPNSRIYLDSWFEGLTITHAEIVALRGSRNFQLIMRYVYRGAKLMETETKMLRLIPVSFMKKWGRRFWEPLWFYNIRIRLFFEIYFWFGDYNFSSALWENMDARDHYVAKRIQGTLLEGETGILFMGAAHDPLKYITDKDIEIIHLPKVILEAYRLMNDFDKKI